MTALLERYGFHPYGYKDSANGRENVYVKNFYELVGDPCRDFPILNAVGNAKWLLAINPAFHSRLFPDSLLRTESVEIVRDLSYTNSIHKVYISFAPNASLVRRDDVIIIYRTAEPGGKAEFTSVATSLCSVEEVRARQSFADVEEFVAYCKRNSVFNEPELREWYKRGPNVATIKMTYNMALPKRPNRRSLADDIGLDRNERWTLLPVTDEQFSRLLEKGQVHEGIVIHQA